MKIERLHQVSLPASDMAGMVEFYQEVLGLDLIAEYEEPGLAFFDLNGTRLMLETGEERSAGVLYLHVQDIEAKVRELKNRGVEDVSEPHGIHTDVDGTFGTQGETEYMAFFKDPGGNLLALVERKI